MRNIRASSTLTVYHDGQFWVGMFERACDGQLSVCRVVFGAEPSNEGIQEFICNRWNSLRFTEAIACAEASRQASSPKRRQREAAREMKRHGPSTKAQQALSKEREAAAKQRKAASRDQRETEKQQRFELRQQKRKEKHRGR